MLTAKVHILCISESRISQSNLVTTILEIPGYTFEHTSTESSAGGTLMCISNVCILCTTESFSNILSKSVRINFCRNYNSK